MGAELLDGDKKTLLDLMAIKGLEIVVADMKTVFADRKSKQVTNWEIISVELHLPKNAVAKLVHNCASARLVDKATMLECCAFFNKQENFTARIVSNTTVVVKLLDHDKKRTYFQLTDLFRYMDWR